jgi:O-methyltransferase involved in polyketide biosynthesis
MTEPGTELPGVDPTRPSPARLYDYYLGGTHNLPVDRALADALHASLPELQEAVWANRAFHQRAAVWMATQAGIGQFIDIGSGLPTQSNTHEAVPGARVVYVDNDPMVAAYATQLLAPDGTTAVVTRDMMDSAGVLSDPGLRALIDPAEPVGLLVTAVMHFMPDSADPYAAVHRYTSALAPGSYLVLSHMTTDNVQPDKLQTGMSAYDHVASGLFPRTRPEVERFFAGLEFISAEPGGEPGLTHPHLWRAEEPVTDSDGARGLYAGVARRP